MTPDPPPALLAEAEQLLQDITPGEWCVWDGPAYVGGGKDLCIGAGDTWLANMDHRYCQNHPHHIGCHDEGCKLEGDSNICSFDEGITAEQQANAAFIAAAPRLVRGLLAEVQRLQEENTELKAVKADLEAVIRHDPSWVRDTLRKMIQEALEDDRHHP